MSEAFFSSYSSAARVRQRSILFETSRVVARVATAGVLACALAGSAPTSANEPLVDQHDFLNGQANRSAGASAELEKLFWMCDVAASANDLDAAQIDQCGVVTANLKRVRFDGDSDAFDAWSSANRATAHQGLAAAGSDMSCRPELSQTEARS